MVSARIVRNARRVAPEWSAASSLLKESTRRKRGGEKLRGLRPKGTPLGQVNLLFWKGK
jgi:hypothetical protein